MSYRITSHGEMPQPMLVTRSPRFDSYVKRRGCHGESLFQWIISRCLDQIDLHRCVQCRLHSIGNHCDQRLSPRRIFEKVAEHRIEFNHALFSRVFGAFAAARWPLRIYNVFACVARIDTMLSVTYLKEFSDRRSIRTDRFI